MRKFMNAILVIALSLPISIHARSEQASGRLLLENEQVLAVEHMIAAGGKLSLESQRPFLFFCVNPFAATLTFKDGHSIRGSFRVDDFRWFEQPIIAVANIGKSEAKFLIVEIKKNSPTSHRDLAPDDATKVATSVYQLLYENDRVRVIRVATRPGQKTAMHSHPGSTFRYSIATTKVRLTTPDGIIRELENEAGVARWTELATRHAHENIGTTKGHALLIEIK
ncbi:MAG TPA: hypothetical protein VJT71_08195 [Pyrinomonadaceae bacterium]|nr:hypothetical protein [Pyrinomonadaceae bacterium]